MNYDVARAVMDPQTTRALGGIVAIDHYVDTPNKLINNIEALAALTGGKIFLGEMGVPIPDINGDMTDKEQADWIQEALLRLSKEPAVVGLNYWVGFGGSTQLWNYDWTPREAVSVLNKFFKAK